MRKKRFGEVLVEAGVVTEEILQQALQRQKGTGKRLGTVLEEMGSVTQRDIAGVLARQFGFKTVSGFAKHRFSPELLGLVESDEAIHSLVFPLKVVEKTLYLAMVNPLAEDVLENITFRTGLKIQPLVTTPAEIEEAVSRHYLKEQQGGENQWTVLVVEDGELVRAATVSALKKMGFHVLEAVNGAEGLQVARDKKPHLILTDMLMPRLDGQEMYAALQEEPALRKIPVVALSGLASAEEEARLLDLGFFDFIPKPVNPVRLVARVRRALRLTYGSAA